MTPLAQRCLRQYLGEPSGPLITDECGVFSLLSDAHCFEVTEILPLIKELALKDKFDPNQCLPVFCLPL